MKYVVVNINGKQYKVSKGEKLSVDKLAAKEGAILEFTEVLLSSDEGKVEIGKPFIKDALVKAKATEQKLGKKLDVFKFKAKTGYRRKMGFRPHLTTLEITEIKA